MSITLSESAEKKIKKLLQDRGNGLGIRLGIKNSGCSGFSYFIEFVDTIGKDDILIDINSIKLVVDKKSYFYLKGTNIDFINKDLHEGFKFNNPNIKNKCGCGESFSI